MPKSPKILIKIGKKFESNSVNCWKWEHFGAIKIGMITNTFDIFLYTKDLEIMAKNETSNISRKWFGFGETILEKNTQFGILPNREKKLKIENQKPNLWQSYQ